MMKGVKGAVKRLVQIPLLIALMTWLLCAPSIQNTNDTQFVVWLAISYTFVAARERFKLILPAYWSCIGFASVTVPFFYKELPQLLTYAPFLFRFRAYHVGLLTCQSGYGLDFTIFKSNKLHSLALISVSAGIDILATFLIMTFGQSFEAAALMAFISLAPSPEAALPLFEYMEYPRKHQDGDEALHAKHMEKALKVFKQTAPVLIVFTIFSFCAITSGAKFTPLGGEEVHVTFVWSTIALRALVGVGVAICFAVAAYFVGLCLVPTHVQPQTKALLLFCIGYFAIHYIGSIPNCRVAPALAALGGTFLLRLSTKFNSEATSILSKIWPWTSYAYYATVAYAVVGHYSSLRVIDWPSRWICIGMLLVSLLAMLSKLLFLTVTSIAFKLDRHSSTTLALALCTKGTVQMALSTILPLRILSDFDRDSFTDYGSLQLFVLGNAFVVSLVVQGLSWLWSSNRICKRRTRGSRTENQIQML